MAKGMSTGMIVLLAIAAGAWYFRDRLAVLAAEAEAGVIPSPYVAPVIPTTVAPGDEGLPGFYVPTEGGLVSKYQSPSHWANAEYAAHYGLKHIGDPEAQQAYAIEYKKYWGEDMPGYVFQRDPLPVGEPVRFDETGPVMTIVPVTPEQRADVGLAPLPVLEQSTPLHEGYIIGSPEALEIQQSSIDEDIEKMANIYVRESGASPTYATTTTTQTYSSDIERIASQQDPRIGL